MRFPASHANERSGRRFAFNTPRFPIGSRQTPRCEILLVTTRRSKRWIIPKGWPIKGLRPAKSAAREAFEEAGIRGRIGTKSVGLFKYDKFLDEHGIEVSCEVKVFPLLVKRQSDAWPEFEQRLVQWVEPSRAVSLIKEPELKRIVATFAKRVAAAASKADSSLIGPRRRHRRPGWRAQSPGNFGTVGIS